MGQLFCQELSEGGRGGIYRQGWNNCDILFAIILRGDRWINMAFNIQFLMNEITCQCRPESGYREEFADDLYFYLNHRNTEEEDFSSVLAMLLGLAETAAILATRDYRE